MKLYECDECGEYYYKKVDKCPYCDGSIKDEVEGTNEEVILSALRELYFSSGEYEEFDYDKIEEKIQEKIGNEYKFMDFSRALDKAEEKGYFTKVIIYVSNT